MVLHAYLDDSDSHGAARKVFSVGGYLATPESWARFAAEWELLLEAYKVGRGKSGRRRFKMSEMAARMEDVPPFFEVIRRHVIGAISIVIYEDELEAAKNRIWSDDVDILHSPETNGRNLTKRLIIQRIYTLMDDPTLLRHGLERPEQFGRALAENRDRVDLYFDADSDDDWSDWWGSVMRDVDEDVRGTRPPQFVSDEEYLPLQAADFWAWWARYGHENNTYGRIADGNFGTWQARDMPPSLSMTVTEDELTRYLIADLYDFAPIRSNINIYDAKKRPRNEYAKPVFRPEKKSAMYRHYELLLRLLRRGR